ncbi:fumarylacetoacetate hydrolase family protein [Microbacterium sp. 179-I 3D2 NHS]|uniref:fumarylacetoacetate hydrolase family protein n=1 Tax=Microbacterium sp. 179-I 3D2 NHS TaxID=3235178 RepID=UPI0039A065C7
MRLASYRLDRRDSYGVVDAAADVDDSAALVIDIPANLADAPNDLAGFLARYDELRDIVGALRGDAVRLDHLELLPVIPDPRNIIAVGVNYVDHATETNDSVPPFPLLFSKFTSSISAHGAPIILPKESTQPDYEAELGIVIARPASEVPAEGALSYVGGYFTFNDVSARDFQNRTSQWTQGKGFPTFAPTGPFLVTPDEFGPPAGHSIRLRIGDEVLQEANTSDMVFDVATIVSYVSGVCALRPGDIIATGTPSGIGAARDPQRFLRPGDVVRVEIDGLPSLENGVTAA